MIRLVPILLLPAALAAQSDTTARPIALDTAIVLAQRNAVEAVQARGQTRVSGAEVRSAYAAFIPNVTLTGSALRQGGQRLGPQGNLVDFTGEPWSYQNVFQANVDLFAGGRRFAELRSAKAAAHAADAGEVRQRYAVALAVKQQYYAALAAREQVAAAQSQLEQAEQQLRAATARVRAGAATKSDSLRSAIQVGNARLALLTAQNDLRVANAALTRLVASPTLVTPAEEPADTLLAPLDSATLAALAAQGPAVEQARAQYTAARAEVRSARAPYLPTLSASYRRTGSSTDSRFRPVDDRYAYAPTFSLQLSLPLFNQWTRETQVVRARVGEDNAEAELRDAQLRAAQELAQYLGLLRSAEQRAAIQSASVAAAEEDLRVQQQRYALGASTLLDVLTSQTQLNQARAGLIEARLDYRVAKAQIEALVGRAL